MPALNSLWLPIANGILHIHSVGKAIYCTLGKMSTLECFAAQAFIKITRALAEKK